MKNVLLPYIIHGSEYKVLKLTTSVKYNRLQNQAVGVKVEASSVDLLIDGGMFRNKH